MLGKKMQIYIHTGGQQHGPLTLEQINQTLRQGELSSDSTLAWYDGCVDWIPLKEVPGVTTFPKQKSIMSTIHVTSPSGAQSQYEESQLRSMWEQGLLREGTQYWTEGMPEWRPINELFHSSSVSPPLSTPQPLHTSSYSYSKDPRSLTSFLVIMLWIGLGFEVVSILSNFAQMVSLGGTYTEAVGAANNARQGLIALGYLGVFIVTGVAFLKWIYRANMNCRGFGARDMKFTAGWSIGYYFIPVLNLVRPYESMKEIWQVSQDPKDWKSQTGSALLGWWWALWLISGFVGQMLFRLSMNADTIDALQAATKMSIFSDIINIFLYLAGVNLVKTIANKQEALVTNG